MALGATREGPGGSGLAMVCPELYIATYLSIPEVPTPRGLLSSPRGIVVSSLGIPGYLGRALIAREAYGRLPLFR